MNDCIFCKIVNKEIPSYRVYEDEYFIALLDLAYVNKGHTLVIPKKHSETILDTDNEILGKIGPIFKIVGNALMKSLECDGFNVIQNNFKAANQVIPHLHFHIIPRIEGDNLPLWSQTAYEDKEIETVLERIKKEIK
jgi:histidine triad (HIT) family protein